MSRPRACPDDTLLLVVQMSRAGWSGTVITELLNGTHVPTPGGRARWWPSYVTKLLSRPDGARLFKAEDQVAELEAMTGYRPDRDDGGPATAGRA